MRSTEKRNKLVEKLVKKTGCEIWSKLIERSIKAHLKYLELKEEKEKQIKETEEKWNIQL